MSMTSSTPTRVEIEAGEWLLAMSQRLVTIDQRNQFEKWLESDPAHVRAYEAGKTILQMSATCSDLLEEARAEDAAASQSRRKWLKYSAAAASALLAFGVVLLAAPELSWFGGHEFQTSTAQVKDFELDDGTRVTLGAASQIAVEFGKSERRVQLRHGEAFFEVARDTSRPFIVMAGATAVRVLGTQFTVNYGEDAVRVAVAEGRVEVVKAGKESLAVSADTPSQRAILTAGETAVATRTGEIVTSSYSDKEDVAAWRQGRLVYVDARLRDVVSDMNRYFGGEITVADEELADRQLTITFRSDEIDRGLDLLEGALPVQAVHAGPKKILLTRR